MSIVWRKEGRGGDRRTGRRCFCCRRRTWGERVLVVTREGCWAGHPAPKGEQRSVALCRECAAGVAAEYLRDGAQVVVVSREGAA